MLMIWLIHGTDTMAYTSSALGLLNHLKNLWFFTGSQLPIGDLGTDAQENLIESYGMRFIWK